MTPTVRRRQRLSSSCTAPAERSPPISSRAMSLRISTGRSSCASVSRSLDLKVKAGFAERQSLEVEGAHDAGVVAAGRWARSTFTVSAPAALSAAASACAGRMPPSTTVIGRLSARRASAPTNSPARPASTPSESQTISTSPVAARKRSSAGSASVRSTVCGFGLIRRSRAARRPAVSSEMSRSVFDSGTIATPRPSASARRDQILGGAQARVPGRGGAPAVVDQQQQRRAAAARSRSADSTAVRRPR